MNPQSLIAYLEAHVAKIGSIGVVGTITLGELNLVVGLAVATLTALALLPVVIVRWMRLFSGRDPERGSRPPFQK